MNFASDADFQYVTGDLSSIVIDNDIMPVRDAERAYDLRGMDIAFLMEAAEERRLARMLQDGGGNTTFSKALMLDQLQGLAEKIETVLSTGTLVASGGNNPDWVWYDGTPSEISSDLLQQYPQWLHMYQGESDIVPFDDNLSVPMTVTQDIERQPIEHMFSNIDNMKKLMRKRFNVFSLRNPTFTKTHVQTGNSSNEQFCQSQISTYIEPQKCTWGCAVKGKYDSQTPTQAYWTVTVSEVDVDYLPEATQCKDAKGKFVGREVYGMFFAQEGYHIGGSNTAVNKFFIKKISDNDGKVTGTKLNQVVNDIKTSGISQYNFEPSSSVFGYNDDYHSWIYLNTVFIFDTLCDRTQWEVPSGE